MEKLPMCRICLAENVPMYVILNKNMHELYKKLTNSPFVTEDWRPILACSICCSKVKKCCRLMMKCLQAEELFAEMTNEDYEMNPFAKQDHLKLVGGLVRTSIQSINIVDFAVTECNIGKPEVPAVCGRQGDVIEIKEELQCDDIKQENFDIGYSDAVDVSFPPIIFEKDSDDDELLMEFKTEVGEEQEYPKQIQKLMENIGSTVVKKPKPGTQRPILEDTIVNKQMKSEKKKISHSKVIQNFDIRKSEPVTTFLELADTKPRIYSFNNNNITVDTKRSNKNRGYYSSKLWKDKSIADSKEKKFKCHFCQRRFNHRGHLTRHIRLHTGEQPHRCDICQRSFSQLSNLKRHILTHTANKPYKCDICQRCFIDKRDLEHHIHEHMGVKPFKCQICHLSFNDKRVLSKHTHTHTVEKPFDCAICQHSFRYASDLKRHVRTHTGEKPYQCDMCQHRFNIKSNLKKHILKHSNEKPFQNGM